MKKEKTVREDIFLVRMKRLTLVALICSILLTAFAIYQSSLPGGESDNSARPVINAVKNWFKVDDTIVPQNIEIDTSTLEKTYYFSGQKVKLPLKIKPDNANKSLDYSFTSDGELVENCFVDDEGYITYVGAHKKEILVTVTSKHDPDVKASATLLYRGISPDDEAVEKVNIRFFDEEQKEEYSLEDLRVGKKYYIKTELIIKDEYLEKYGLTANTVHGGYIPYKLQYDYDGKDQICLFDSYNRYITFTKEFTGNFKFKFNKTTDKYFSDKSGEKTVNPVIKVSAKSYPDYDYMPSEVPKLNTDKFGSANGIICKEISENEYVITVPYNIQTITLAPYEAGENINVMGELRFADEESENIGYTYSRTLLSKKVNKGVCNIYWVSLFNEDIRMKIKVVFEGYIPQKLSIYGKETLSFWSTSNYTAGFDKDIYDEKAVKLSIVKGDDVATLEDGKLIPKKIGNVTLRAESEYYPELNCEMTVKIRMWEDFNGFLRKAIGHFLIFFFLGQGYIVCYLFLIKKRWVSLIVTPATLFAVAGITELIQYYTPGRAAKWLDVFLNFFGGILGIIFVFICFAVYIFILRKVRPKSFEKLKKDLPKMSIFAFFKKV